MKREISFQNGFEGKLHLETGDVRIGAEGAAPYDLLFGALASCLYSTFLDIVVKKRLDVVSTVVTVDGEKREDVPKMLQVVHVKAVVKADPANRDALVKSFELATKYCSIYQTISHVAKMSWECIVE